MTYQYNNKNNIFIMVPEQLITDTEYEIYDKLI